MRLFSPDVRLSAAAYSPTAPPEGPRIEIRLRPLALGSPLPVLPLAVRGLGSLPLDLEATYTQARRFSRL
jgi:hypothetical protein